MYDWACGFISSDDEVGELAECGSQRDPYAFAWAACDEVVDEAEAAAAAAAAAAAYGFWANMLEN